MLEKKRGGARRGAGRKPKAADEKAVTLSLRISPQLYAEFMAYINENDLSKRKVVEAAITNYIGLL